MSALRASEDPAVVAGALADPAFAAVDEDPLHGRFGRAYYPAVTGAERRDASFVILAGDAPVLVVPLSEGSSTLDHHGLPARLFPRAGLGADEIAEAMAAAIAHLTARAEASGGLSIVLRDDGGAGALSALGTECLNRGFAPAVRIVALADLVDGEAGLRRGLRKSYRSLVNWGRRNLHIEIVDAARPDQARFEAYRAFHREVAGHVTRSAESWDASFRLVAEGWGELVLGYLGDDLVAGTLVADGTASSYYASGVYDRARFDKPMAHWPLWLAMTRSMERGRRVFELGDVPAEGEASAKEVAIGHFKRGFATRLVTRLVWTRAARPGDRAAG